jgi:hypothetical protein
MKFAGIFAKILGSVLFYGFFYQWNKNLWSLNYQQSEQKMPKIGACQ